MFEKDLKEIDNLKNQWADLLSVEDVYSEKWNLYYDVQFVYDSNRIEGSTLSLIDTALLIEKGLSAKGKPFVHHLDAINHKNALDFIKTKALSNTALDEAVLLKIHETVLEHNKGNAGVYRRANVRITNTTFLPPNYVKVPHLMEMLFQFYTEQKEKSHPAILSADLHQRFVNIHPFVDGNGRTARLIMNYHLLQNGFVLTNIKSSNRASYYKALQSYHEKKDATMFRKYIIKCIKNSFQEQLKILTKNNSK